jgi:hypothetical protein
MSNFFPQVLYFAWSVARGDAIILKGNLLSVSFCAGSGADCNPVSSRTRPASDKAAVRQADFQSLQVSVLAKTSMDEAPESDEAWPMARILAWASLWASR